MPSEIPRSYYSTRFALEDSTVESGVSFAIVTACNPHDQPRADDANATADQTLHAELLRLKLAPFRVTGGSPDWTHTEPGWGFKAALEIALEIAINFDQRALWWIEDGELFLVDCSHPILQSVGRFSDRIIDPPT